MFYMKFSSIKFILTPVLSSMILSACGGGGGSQPTTNTQNPPPITEEENNPLKIDEKFGGFTIKDPAFNGKSDITFSPFHPKTIFDVRASANTIWDLRIQTPTNELSPYVNPSASFRLTVDEIDPSKIIDIEYQEEDENKLNISCTSPCSSYSYKIVKEIDGKTYFTLSANGTVSGSWQGKALTQNAVIKGQIKFEIDQRWPVWQSNRFKVNQPINTIKINGNPTQLRKFSTFKPTFSDNIELANIEFEDNTELFFDLGRPNFSYSKKDPLTQNNLFFYVYEGNYPTAYNYMEDYQNGIKEFKFVKNIFNAPITHTSPEISLSGNIQQAIPSGEIKTSEDIFYPKIFNPYSNNESKFFNFEDENSRINLNVKYNLINKTIDLAFQKPKPDRINVNIHEDWNCKLVNGTCPGVTIAEDESSISFKNVLLIDGRVLNGKIINIGINP